MALRTPSIACIGVIGRHVSHCCQKTETDLQNNPLHISLFAADDEGDRDRLGFSFMLSTCLDIFEARMPTKTVSQDFGLLQALDERLAMYGWMTNTGVKFVVVVDMEGRRVPADKPQGKGAGAVLGLRNSDVTPVSVRP